MLGILDFSKGYAPEAIYDRLAADASLMDWSLTELYKTPHG